MPLAITLAMMTPLVMDCVTLMDDGHGYTVLWQAMSRQEKHCVERICKKDKIKRMRVQMLKISDKGDGIVEIPRSYNKENLEGL